MNHSDAVQALACAAGWDLDAYAVARRWAGVNIGPVNLGHDASILDRSNWHVVTTDLRERFRGSVDIVTLDLVEHLASDTGRAGAQAAIAAWRDALHANPVADALHFSEASRAVPLAARRASR